MKYQHTEQKYSYVYTEYTIDSYALSDVNNDSSKELIIRIKTGWSIEDSLYLILGEKDGKLYGSLLPYELDLYTENTFKVDGVVTLNQSTLEVQNTGYLIFDDGSWNVCYIAKTETYNDTIKMYLYGDECSFADFTAYMEHHQRKDNVTWIKP